MSRKYKRGFSEGDLTVNGLLAGLFMSFITLCNVVLHFITKIKTPNIHYISENESILGVFKKLLLSALYFKVLFWI